jgi:lipopolysaccharide transport system permease protein
METEPARPTVVIDPASKNRGWGLKELYDRRQMAYYIFWREIKVKYKQAVLGVAWAIIRPFMNMVVFATIFGKLANLPSDGVPYPIFAFCGILPWQLFSQALSATTGSLISNRSLIDKIYFPRMIFPIAGVFSSLFDFFIAFTMLVVMMFYYGVTPGWNILALPAIVLLVCFAALALGLWLGSLSVRFRDFRHVLPFAVQFWFYATPVVYSLSLVPDEYRVWYNLNPMVGVIEAFRWSLLGHSKLPTDLLIQSCLIIFVLLLIGIKFFQRTDRTIADVI